MLVVQDCGTLKVKSSFPVPSALAIQSGMDWVPRLSGPRDLRPIKLLRAKTVHCCLRYTEQGGVLTGSWEELGFWVGVHGWYLNAELRTCSLDTLEPQGFIVLFLPTAAFWILLCGSSAFPLTSHPKLGVRGGVFDSLTPSPSGCCSQWLFFPFCTAWLEQSACLLTLPSLEASSSPGTARKCTHSCPGYTLQHQLQPSPCQPGWWAPHPSVFMQNPPRPSAPSFSAGELAPFALRDRPREQSSLAFQICLCPSPSFPLFCGWQNSKIPAPCCTCPV